MALRTSCRCSLGSVVWFPRSSTLKQPKGVEIPVTGPVYVLLLLLPVCRMSHMESHRSVGENGLGHSINPTHIVAPPATAAPKQSIPILKFKLGGTSATVASGIAPSLVSLPQQIPQGTKPENPAVHLAKPSLSVSVNLPSTKLPTQPSFNSNVPQAPAKIAAPQPFRAEDGRTRLDVPISHPPLDKPLAAQAPSLRVTLPKPPGFVPKVESFSNPVLPLMPTPPPAPRPLQTTGTTLAAVMGLSAGPNGGAGIPKLSSKFVFKLAKPNSAGDSAGPVVLGVEQRPKLFIRLPRLLVVQELERLKRKTAQKSTASAAKKKGKRIIEDDGMGPNDEFIDVDGDNLAPPAPKRYKVSETQSPSAGIEGYASPPEGAVLVPFEAVPNYVPTADPGKKYLPLKKVLHSTVRALIQLDKQGFFYQPVTEDQAPGYFEVVSRPMDFITMRRKIDDNRYPFFSLFQYDFEQIIRNCLDYNDADSVFCSDAQTVLRSGREIIAINRLKVHPRQLEAPPEVLQYALAEDEKIRQKEAEERLTASNNPSSTADVSESLGSRSARLSAQRAMGAVSGAYPIDEDEDNPRGDVDYVRQNLPQPLRTFTPKRHYVELPPQPKVPNGSASVLPTAVGTTSALPIGMGRLSGRPGSGPSGPSTRSIPLLGPDGRPLITPFNRWQMESHNLLKMVNHKFGEAPLALQEYAHSLRSFIGSDENWAPIQLKKKIDAFLDGIADSNIPNPPLWSSCRIVNREPRPTPVVTSNKSSSSLSDINEQLSRLHVTQELLVGNATESLTFEETTALQALIEEFDLKDDLSFLGPLASVSSMASESLPTRQPDALDAQH